MENHAFKLAAAALALTLVLTPSAHAETRYQPSQGSRSQYGYSETQIDSNRMRVSFSADRRTDRETVERYLLFRAAEITLQRGFDNFVVVDHFVEAKSDFDRFGPPGPLAQYREEVRYHAVSDIIMTRGPRLLPDAFDARAVQANLADQVRRPA